MNLQALTLDEAERAYRHGSISEDELCEYLRLWNAGPHMTQAVLWDGRVRNDVPERMRMYPDWLIKKCGVIL